MGFKVGDRVSYRPLSEHNAALPHQWIGRLGTVAAPSSTDPSGNHTCWAIRFDDVEWSVGGTASVIVRGSEKVERIVNGEDVVSIAVESEAAQNALMNNDIEEVMSLCKFVPLVIQYPIDAFTQLHGSEHQNYSRADFEPYARFPEHVVRDYIASIFEANKDGSTASLNSAIGVMVGMAVGDAVGAPLEFLPATDKPFAKDSSGRRHGFSLKSLEYTGEINQFSLKRGQWTDDAAMGMCMADSLVANRGFNGADMRIRFHCWWHHGYNNAFLRDYDHATSAGGKLPHSVGLGGNISKSLRLVAGEVPQPEVASGSEDAGNGSLMRLGPISIFYSSDLKEVRAAAHRSSKTTHPGNLAAYACELLVYLTASAIQNPPEIGRSPGSKRKKSLAAQWLDCRLDDFKKLLESEGKSGEGWDTIIRLINGNEPKGSTEACWNWRDQRLRINATIQARGTSYNGYPVSAGYFGSFCLDGLAIALHAIYNTNSFNEAIERCVNYLGDADSTASVTGQLAGAIYGYSSIDIRFVENLAAWDGFKAQLRAIVLHQLGRQLNKEIMPSV